MGGLLARGGALGQAGLTVMESVRGHLSTMGVYAYMQSDSVELSRYFSGQLSGVLIDLEVAHLPLELTTNDLLPLSIRERSIPRTRRLHSTSTSRDSPTMWTTRPRCRWWEDLLVATGFRP